MVVAVGAVVIEVVQVVLVIVVVIPKNPYCHLKWREIRKKLKMIKGTQIKVHWKAHVIVVE